MANTIPVTTSEGAVFSFTQVSRREFGSIWTRSTQLTKSRFISLAPFVGNDIFVLRVESVVSNQLPPSDGIQPRSCSFGSAGSSSCSHYRGAHQTESRNEAMALVGGKSV